MAFEDHSFTSRLLERLVALLLAASFLYASVLGQTHSAGFMAPASLLCVLAGAVSALGLLKQKRHLGPLALLAIGFLVMCCVRVYLSDIWTLAKQDLGLIVGAFGVLLGSLFSSRDRVSFFIITGCMLLVILGNAVASIYQKIWDADFFPLALFGVERSSNALSSGLSSHPNPAANMMVFGVLLGFVSLALGTRKHVVWGLCFGSVCLVGLLFTGSRGAFFGLAVGCLAMLVISAVAGLRAGKSARGRLRRILCVGAASLMVSVITFSFAAWEKSDAASQGVISSLSEKDLRLPLMLMGLETSRDAVWFGHGSRAYEVIAPVHWHRLLPHYAPDPRMVHNDFIQFALEYGYPALALLLVLLCWIFVRVGLAIACEVGGERSSYLGGLLAGLSMLVAFVFHALLDFPGHSLPNLMVFTFVAATLIAHVGQREERDVRDSAPRASVVACVIALLALCTAGAGVGKTLQASWPLMAVRGGNEVGPWEPSSERLDLMVRLHEESLELQQDYRRNSRLALCYFAVAARTTDSNDKRIALERARDALKAALDEAPMLVNERANLALAYEKLSEMDKALETWMQVADRGKYREYWAKGSQNLARLYLEQARAALRENENNATDLAYKNGWDAIRLSAERAPLLQRTPDWAEIAVSLRSEMASLLSQRSQFTEAQAMFEDTASLAFSATPRFRALKSQHLILFGDSLWRGRWPEAAAHAYLVAAIEMDYLRKNENESFTAEMARLEDKAQEKLRFLRRVGIEPSEKAFRAFLADAKPDLENR